MRIVNCPVCGKSVGANDRGQVLAHTRSDFAPGHLGARREVAVICTGSTKGARP